VPPHTGTRTHTWRAGLTWLLAWLCAFADFCVCVVFCPNSNC